jgi:hypothetical protein
MAPRHPRRSTVLPCDSKGRLDYKSITFVAQVSGVFAALIYAASLLSGSSAVTALFAFTVLFSTGMWVLSKADAFLWRIEKLEHRERMVTLSTTYLEQERTRVSTIIKARLSMAEKMTHQMLTLLAECQQICKAQFHEERARLYTLMDTERLKQFLEAVFKTKYKVAKDESVCTKAVEDIIMALTCPIAFEVPKDPVVSSSGVVYSHSCLLRHFTHTGSRTCPLANTRINRCIKALPVTEICNKLRELEAENRLV